MLMLIRNGKHIDNTLNANAGKSHLSIQFNNTMSYLLYRLPGAVPMRPLNDIVCLIVPPGGQGGQRRNGHLIDARGEKLLFLLECCFCFVFSF